MPDRARAFEEVARLYGTVNRQPPSQRRRLTSFRVGGGPVNPNIPQAGSFQHLKEIILTERARELQVIYIYEWFIVVDDDFFLGSLTLSLMNDDVNYCSNNNL